jgi:hypothetical protein
MNYISQRNRLEMQLQNYIKFTEYCPRNSFLKLSMEMVRITERIEILNRMTLSELTKQVPEYYDTKHSKINLKTV